MNTNDTIYTNDNTVFNDNAVNATINNKGFSILDSIFKQYQWHLVKNDLNFISYTKVGDETNHFDFKILKDKIVVSVPIKNSSKCVVCGPGTITSLVFFLLTKSFTFSVPWT